MKLHASVSRRDSGEGDYVNKLSNVIVSPVTHFNNVVICDFSTNN